MEINLKVFLKKTKNLKAMVIYILIMVIYIIGHLENGLKEGKGILIKKNGDKFEGILKDDKEYTGINFINNNKIRIEKGNIKESELILDIKKEQHNVNLYTENKSKDQNNYSTEENNHNSKSLKQEKMILMNI